MDLTQTEEKVIAALRRLDNFTSIEIRKSVTNKKEAVLVKGTERVSASTFDEIADLFNASTTYENMHIRPNKDTSGRINGFQIHREKLIHIDPKFI